MLSQTYSMNLNLQLDEWEVKFIAMCLWLIFERLKINVRYFALYYCKLAIHPIEFAPLMPT